MKKEISNFIKENKIACVACIDDSNIPYCFHCMYVYDEENQLLFFKSSSNSYHSKALLRNLHVAGSILPERNNILALKGIQFTGIILTKDFPADINPELFYHKNIPLALIKPGDVWCIQLEMVKMTDNTAFWGEKLNWRRTRLVNESD